MNKRKKKKQKWLQWIGGDYKSFKMRDRQHHEETVAFKKKGRAGHLIEDDIKNFWMKGLDIDSVLVEQMCFQKRERGLRGNKIAFKRVSKWLAQRT